MTSNLIWSKEDSIVLFAWIDFCAENGLSFSKTIKKHLTDTRRARGHTLQFSNDQIKSKLGDLFREYLSPQDGAHLKTLDVVKDGSQLLRLPEVIKQRVDTTVAEYEIIYAHMLDDKGDSSKKLHKSDQSKASSTPLSSGCSMVKVQGNSPSENIVRRPYLRFSLQNGGQKKLTRMKSETPRKRSIDTIPDRPTSTKSAKEPQVDGKAPKMSHKGSEPLTCEANSQSNINCSHQDQGDCTTLPLGPNSNDIVQMIKIAEQAVLKEKNHEIASIRAQWRHEVEELEEERRSQAETSKTLRAENIDLILALQKRERDGKDPSEAKLFELSQIVGAQARQIGKMRDLNTFVHGDPGHGSLLATEDIKARLSSIRSELESMMISHCITVPTLKRDADLDSLVRAMSDDGVGKGGEMRWLRKCAAKFNTGIVVRSLLLGALREWVFGTAFPDFRPMDRRLLGVYREIIITNDGWNSLHNLELAAYSKLVGRERFQLIDIPDRAQGLTLRLVKALSLLFLDDSSQGSGQQVSVKQWPNLINESIQVHLTEIFEIALRLKAATVTTDYEYEFVVYPPGTPSPNDAVKNANDDGIRKGPNDDRRVLCLASIHRYIPNVAFPSDPTADALVQSNNFITTTKERRENQSDFKAFLEVPGDEIIVADPIIEICGQRPQKTYQLSDTTPKRASNVEVTLVPIPMIPTARTRVVLMTQWFLLGVRSIGARLRRNSTDPE